MTRFPVIMALVPTLLLSGCSGDVKFENPNYQGTSISGSSSDATDAPEFSDPHSQEIQGSFGKVVNTDKFEILLNSARFSNGSGFYKPSQGKFLIFNFTFKNISNESVTLSSASNFELQGSDLYTYSTSFLADTKGPLDSEIAPGNSLRGEIAFDVPNLPSYELRFRNGIFDDVILTYEVDSNKVAKP